MTRDKKKEAAKPRSNPPNPNRRIGGAHVKRLGIVYEERHRTHVIRLLAEMYKPSEVAALMIQEYRDEWKITGENTEDALQRVEAIRLWMLQRASLYAYATARKGIQVRIREMREEIRTDLEEHYRDANKFARIADLAKIKELAMKDGQFSAAVRALVALREELEGTKLRIDGTITHNHRVITPESEIEAQLADLLKEIGISSDRAHSFIRSIDAPPGTRPDSAEEKSLEVAPGPRQLYGRTPGSAEGVPRVEHPPRVQKP